MKRLISSVVSAFVLAALARPAAAYTPVIDAGHGGFDGGAVSSSGVIESGLNLAISLKTAALFRLFGVDPVLIRETDTAVGDGSRSGRTAKAADLRRRVEIVEETEDAFLISIHQNMFGDSRYGGAHIFYKGEEAKPLAEALQRNVREQLDPENTRETKPVANDVYLFRKITCPGILAECGFLSNSRDLAELQDEGHQKKLACLIVSGLLTLESGGM